MEACRPCANLPIRATRVETLSPVLTQCTSGLAFALAFRSGRFFVYVRERARVAQFLVTQQRVAANTVEQIGLLRLQHDQPAKDVEKVEQVAGVFLQPMVRLDRIE